MKRLVLTLILLPAILFTINAQESTLPQMEQVSKDLYRYGETEFTKTQYMQFLDKNCYRAYVQYKRGNNCVIAGITCLATGVTMYAVGGCLLGVCYGTPKCSDSRSSVDYDACYAAGWSLVTVGTALNIASIPLWVCGARARSKSVDVFNNRCAGHESPMAMRLNIQPTGLGLSMTF